MSSHLSQLQGASLKQGAIVHGLSWQPLAHMHAFGYLPTLFCWNVKGVCLG